MVHVGKVTFKAGVTYRPCGICGKSTPASAVSDCCSDTLVFTVVPHQDKRNVTSVLDMVIYMGRAVRTALDESARYVRMAGLR